jgi:hypothetical protein
LADALEKIADKNGWKWTAPLALEGEGGEASSESPTAALPASGGLG